MRFILVYKYGILQTKTQRIDVNFCENTSQLLDYLQKRVQQSKKNFIVKFRKGKVHLRIIADWSLDYYGLKQGTQLHIEFIQKLQQQSMKNSKYSNRYMNNILGLNRSSVQQIKEQKQRQQQEQEEDFNVRKYLDAQCQRMLKQIKAKSLVGFFNIFQYFPDDVPESAIVQIKQKKMQIIDQLGEKGWGALHYAIFYEAQDIIDQLLDLQVDVNKCTSDGWLPMQLAIDLKNIDIIQKLLDDQNINLNLVTSKGSPIHTAARIGNKQILMILLEKQIDIHLKDNSGKKAHQVCKDEDCKKLLIKQQQKRQSYNQYVRGNLPLSLTTIFKGKVMKAKRPFMNLKQRYLVVDPFQGSIIRYESFSDYPKKPKQITPLRKLKGIRIVPQNQKSWHMKKELSYFIIQQPNNEIYGCKFRHTAQKWTSNLNLAIKFAQELQKNHHLISDIKKHQVQLEDTEFDAQQKKKQKKKLTRDLFANSLLSKQSTISNRNSQNPVQMAVYRNGSTKRSNVIKQQQIKKSDEKQTRIEQSPEDKVQNRKKQIKQQSQELSKKLNQITQSKVNFASFNIIKTLGSGAFGKVFLVTYIPTGKQYALKALKKKNLIMQKQLKYAIIQANILKQANNHFIVNLYFAFQTPHYLYLALDYCPGRDLSFHLARQVTFSQKQSRFYIAQLIIAIQHLHSKKIIYRDLKPQNILLDEHGHIKLADFGLSKQTGENDKTKSFCGSPAYLSPEMLNQKGVGKESDLYGIGTVLYEFLIGQPPYFSDDIPTLYRNIKEGKLKFPKNVSESAKSLILALLQRDPKKRLGHKGMHQIKQHQFFSSIDWQKLSQQKLKPPQRPSLDDSNASDDDMDIIKNKNPNFTDFDYDDSTKKINRLMNFSFIRQT